MPSLNIPTTEFKTRAEKLLEHLRAQKLNGIVLFDAQYILYYTGFAFIPTERPIAFVLNTKGERGLLVPREDGIQLPNGTTHPNRPTVNHRAQQTKPAAQAIIRSYRF